VGSQARRRRRLRGDRNSGPLDAAPAHWARETLVRRNPASLRGRSSALRPRVRGLTHFAGGGGGGLSKRAARALVKLAADPHHVGGLVGVLAILHTWTRTLECHPHVHCPAPDGGLSDDGQWLPARSNYLVPVKALSRISRGDFLGLAAKQLPPGLLPPSFRRRAWVVYTKPSDQGPENVLSCLGRYVHRIAIISRRTLAIDDGKVTFRYRPSGQAQWKTLTLGREELTRRFPQHVVPKGLHKVRYFGLWTPAKRGILRTLQHTLSEPKPADSVESPPSEPESASPHTLEGSPCPFCRDGTPLHVRRIRPPRRTPP